MAGNRAWSLLTIEGLRQYGGNAGYSDDPSSVNRYDSNVANHLQVSEGDVAIIRSRTDVLGIAEIAQVTKGVGQKTSLRCPECGSTNIKERARKQPKWSWKFWHEFNLPNSEMSEVVTYSAHYAETFLPTSELLDLQCVHDATLRPSDQMSIKEGDLAKIEMALKDLEGAGTIFRRFAAGLELGEVAVDPDVDIESIIEGRRKVLREISLRR